MFFTNKHRHITKKLPTAFKNGRLQTTSSSNNRCDNNTERALGDNFDHNLHRFQMLQPTKTISPEQRRSWNKSDNSGHLRGPGQHEASQLESQSLSRNNEAVQWNGPRITHLSNLPPISHPNPPPIPLQSQQKKVRFCKK